MPKITINGVEYEVPEGITVIQACDMNNIQIPRMCYHSKLPIVGSCRMCLVELKGAPKLVSSCSTSVTDGMEVITENEAIFNARASMLELLLVNHPLDCPICDKAGECDLQDQTYRYAKDRSYINVDKRALTKKSFSPLIDAYMTRCILCTRCVRFATEIAGVDALGGIGKGVETEINTMVENSVLSELSGNLTDVCPVGALTNSDYAFKARPWETINTDTIDVLDALGSNIKVNANSTSVLRIMPRRNDYINQEWLGDKSRYIVDALRCQRLDNPMVRVNGKLQHISWDEALNILKTKLVKVGSSVAAIAGDFVDIETMYAAKSLLSKLGSNKVECRTHGINYEVDNRSKYLFNTTIAGIDKSDSCLLIGSNPKLESPVLNARIRHRYLQDNYSIGLIGKKVKLTYNYDHLGDTLSALEDIVNGKSQYCNVLKVSNNPMIIIGLGAIQGDNYNKVMYLVDKLVTMYPNLLTQQWNGINILHTSISEISGLEIGFSQNNTENLETLIKDVVSNNVQVLWLLNYDNINASEVSKDTFVVYQGHHGDQGAKLASLILPSSLWLENSSLYVNLEGRAQLTNKAIPPIGNTKDGWKIVRKLAEMLNVDLGFDTHNQLLEEIFNNHDNIILNQVKPAVFKSSVEVKANNYDVNELIETIISNYYITDVISRHSIKMSEVVNLLLKKGA